MLVMATLHVWDASPENKILQSEQKLVMSVVIILLLWTMAKIVVLCRKQTSKMKQCCYAKYISAVLHTFHCHKGSHWYKSFPKTPHVAEELLSWELTIVLLRLAQCSYTFCPQDGTTVQLLFRSETMLTLK